MKKTLIALAALAAAGATLAQSSVTLYGRMDLGMSQLETTVPGAAPTARTDAFSLAGAQDTWTASRLGFRGTEDLGGGLRAGFVYEIGINADRDAPGNANTRLANLSLTGGFGTVVVGTFMNSFDAVRGFSPANNNISGANFIASHGAAIAGVPAAARFTTQVDTRSQNAIAYVSPNFNGFTLSAGTVNERVRNFDAAGNRTAGAKLQGVLLGANFTQGPLAVQFAFRDAAVGTGIAPDTDLRDWGLGARYNFGPAVVSFIYEDGRNTNATVRNRFNAWEIGARFPMGAFAPYVTFGQGEIRTGAESNDTSGWQVGTTYNLSARTWVYAGIGEFQRDNANGTLRAQREGFALGLVHTF